jgi:hypothetical protein
MKFRLLALLVLATGMISTVNAQGRLGFGIRIGVPPPLLPEVVLAAPYPGACWMWGHWIWSPHHGRNVWYRGYWAHRRALPIYRARHCRVRPERRLYRERFER